MVCKEEKKELKMSPPHPRSRLAVLNGQPQKDVRRTETSAVSVRGKALFQVFPPVLSSSNPAVDICCTLRQGRVISPPEAGGGGPHERKGTRLLHLLHVAGLQQLQGLKLEKPVYKGYSMYILCSCINRIPGQLLSMCEPAR
jgi:hypothetical protein